MCKLLPTLLWKSFKPASWQDVQRDPPQPNACRKGKSSKVCCLTSLVLVLPLTYAYADAGSLRTTVIADVPKCRAPDALAGNSSWTAPHPLREGVSPKASTCKVRRDAGVRVAAARNLHNLSNFFVLLLLIIIIISIVVLCSCRPQPLLVLPTTAAGSSSGSNKKDSYDRFRRPNAHISISAESAELLKHSIHNVHALVLDACQVLLFNAKPLSPVLPNARTQLSLPSACVFLSSMERLSIASQVTPCHLLQAVWDCD